MEGVSVRDVVKVPGRKRDHPGVVFRIENDVAFVIWGTGNACPDPVHVVRAGTRDARALRLNKDTYFAAENVVMLASTDLKPWFVEHRPAGIGRSVSQPLRCPPQLFLELRELGEKGLAQG